MSNAYHEQRNPHPVFLQNLTYLVLQMLAYLDTQTKILDLKSRVNILGLTM